MDSILVSSELLLKDNRDDFGFRDPIYRKELELLKKKRLKELKAKATEVGWENLVFSVKEIN